MAPHVCRVVVIGLLSLPAHVSAQAAGTQPARGAVLFTAGGAAQPYVFGDDAPKRNTEAGLTVGFQGWKPLSTSKAVVVEVAFHPTGVRNPWFDETVRVVHMLIGVEFGERTYVRPAAGVGLAFWTAFREAEGSIEPGLALGVAVGHRMAAGARFQMSPEFFWRATAGPGYGTPSYGAQLAMGRRTR